MRPTPEDCATAVNTALTIILYSALQQYCDSVTFIFSFVCMYVDGTHDESMTKRSQAAISLFPGSWTAAGSVPRMAEEPRTVNG